MNITRPLALAALLTVYASSLMAAPPVVPPSAPTTTAPAITHPAWLAPIFWYDVDPSTWTQADAERIQRDADAGDAQGRYFAGVLREDGKLVPRDVSGALRYYQLAATQGNASAQASLARMLISGWATAKDDKKALEWNTKAVEQGNRRAVFNQGLFARRNLLTPGGETAALAFFQRSADLGLPHGMLEMARHYRKQKHNPEDNEQAWTWLNQAADAKFAPALVAIDRWCNETPDWPACLKIAPGALLAASEMGYDVAQLGLGLRLWDPSEKPAGWSEGMREQLVQAAPDAPGLERDKPAGAQWLNRAARGGNKQAFYNIGFVLEDEKYRSTYQPSAFAIASVGTIRTCYYQAATESIPQAMMALLVNVVKAEDANIFSASERQTVVDYWTGKIGETGAFEQNRQWAMQNPNWREKIGSAAPGYLTRGMGKPEDCAILPVAKDTERKENQRQDNKRRK